MSEATVIDPPETFTSSAVPLLREYHQKLVGLKEQLRSLKEAAQASKYADDTVRIVVAEYRALQQLFKRTRPAAQDLARQVSGMIDQGKVTPLERAELKLRLAEFESILTELPDLISAYTPV